MNMTMPPIFIHSREARESVRAPDGSDGHSEKCAGRRFFLPTDRCESGTDPTDPTAVFDTQKAGEILLIAPGLNHNEPQGGIDDASRKKSRDAKDLKTTVRTVRTVRLTACRSFPQRSSGDRLTTARFADVTAMSIRRAWQTALTRVQGV